MALNDINQMFSIVDPATGKPTDYLMRLLRDRGIEVTDIDALVKILEQNVTDLDAIVQALNGTSFTAGTGLSGGGTLGTDDPINYTLDAGIDDLTDVDTATTPPTDGQALIWDEASGLWIPGTVSGGGGGGAVALGFGTNLSRGSSTPSVNFHIARLVCAEADMTIRAVGFHTTSAAAGARYRPFIYSATSSGGVTGSLLSGGSEIVGTVAGYNEAPLTSSVSVTKGSWYYVGASVTNSAIANLLGHTGRCSFFSNGGSNVPPTTPPAFNTNIFSAPDTNVYGFFGVV